MSVDAVHCSLRDEHEPHLNLNPATDIEPQWCDGSKLPDPPLRVRVSLDLTISPGTVDELLGNEQTSGTLHSLCRAYLFAQYEQLRGLGITPDDLDAKDGLQALELCLIETVAEEGLISWANESGYADIWVLGATAERLP